MANVPAQPASSAVAGTDRSDNERSRMLLSQQGKPRGLARDAMRRLLRNPGATAGLVVMIAIILVAIFAPVLAPYDPIDQDSQAIRARPSSEHLFGADTFGRDVFSRVLYGGRKSLPIGLIAVG